MSTPRKIFGALLILTLASLVFWLPADMPGAATQPGQRSALGAAVSLTAQQEEPEFELFVGEPVTPTVTIALADAPADEAEFLLDREINPRLAYNTPFDPNYDPPGGPDPLLALQERAPEAQPDAFGTPMLNFNGQGYSSVNPPDTIGEVGPNHYVQMINGSGGTRVRFYNKSTGAAIGNQVILDALAPGSSACSSGNGDPIILYDHLASRWMLSEFASSGNHLCVYVSLTSDPMGSYYFYDFTTPNFPDYPKYAVWSDAYYVTSNESGGPAIYALNRNHLLAGQTTTFQRFVAPALSGFGFQALTPADLDGPAAPSGTPGLFMRHRDTEVHGPSGYPSRDLLELWGLSVDWTTPANSTFSKIADIQVAEFDSTLCGLTSFSCMQQPGSSVLLDPLREVIMWRLAYRNFGSRQVLAGNFVTDVDGANRAGIRWFELRKTGSGAWSLYQEGTYAPGSVNRWMGAIAMDGSGNMAMGYNVSSGSTYPSLRYVGRLATDPLGTMPQGEHTLVNGSAANGSNRYGDYSAMSVDPTDNCTFWFTGQYNAAGAWSTRIGKFKFDQCGGVPPSQFKLYIPLLLRMLPATTGTIAGRVTNAQTSAAIAGAQVCVTSTSQCATTNAQGNYSISNVQAGSQSVQASANGYVTQTQNVTVVAGNTVTLNFALTPNPSGWIDIATENFESTFPATGWVVEDNYQGTGEFYWGKRTCRPRTGSYSGWSVGGGANGRNLACGSNYPNDAFSWMIYGPFSLQNATDAELLFDFWLNSEPNYDGLFVGASIDGNDFYGAAGSGNSNGWLSDDLDLTSVPTIGSLLGRSSVWIAFMFISDDTVTYAEGAYVDNIVLRKKTGSVAEQATEPISCARVQQGDLVRDPCMAVTIEAPPPSSK